MSTATHTGIRNGVRDVEAELTREADLVAERFPDAPRATIDEAIRHVYRELAATATVRAHLFTITGSVVMNWLRSQGLAFRPPKQRSSA
jgi:hypothetical protein